MTLGVNVCSTHNHILLQPEHSLVTLQPEQVLLVLVAIKRTVFCWQCFSDLGLALIVHLRCLHKCRQFGWHRMVPFLGLGQSAHLPYYGVYNNVPHFSVLAA